MNEKLNRLKEIIKDSDNIVFFGGAGVSTESGIPDFRGSNGLYNNKSDKPVVFVMTPKNSLSFIKLI
jgi:NAD-dependent deacetylase